MLTLFKVIDVTSAFHIYKIIFFNNNNTKSAIYNVNEMYITPAQIHLNPVLISDEQDQVP